jgi:hypothetical protein
VAELTNAALPLGGSTGRGVLNGLPERAAVPWRPRVDEPSLRRRGRLWTLATFAHTVPLIGAATMLGALVPVTIPVSIALLIHAWAIPELYAARGAGVLRPRADAGDLRAERRAAGVLEDLISARASAVRAATGLLVERGQLGTWIVGEAGAVLVRPHRVYCYCVRATGDGLPGGDRIAHLLLALRCDERDFATVANLAFSGAPWRLRRRLRPHQRDALRTALRWGCCD